MADIIRMWRIDRAGQRIDLGTADTADQAIAVLDAYRCGAFAEVGGAVHTKNPNPRGGASPWHGLLQHPGLTQARRSSAPRPTRPFRSKPDTEEVTSGE